MSQKLVFTNDIEAALSTIIGEKSYNRIFLLVDSNTRRFCLPCLSDSFLAKVSVLEIGCGDEQKTLETLASVWSSLSTMGATRHSLMINLGGGMLTDLGGMAAATFKRGFDFVNVPTTLLGAVDAAVGGKTGINFCGLKNEIGVFAPAQYVLISSLFYKTLSSDELISGYAEVLKHGLLSDHHSFDQVLSFDLFAPDYRLLDQILETSVKVKQRIVEQDPYERGLRKALNLGHTVGHSIESWAMGRGEHIPHGYAVAWGIVSELYLSMVYSGFPKEDLRRVVQFVKSYYGAVAFGCEDYDRLVEYMSHDKKNSSSDVINFTFLKNLGDIQIDQSVDAEQIKDALDFLREM